MRQVVRLIGVAGLAAAATLSTGLTAGAQSVAPVSSQSEMAVTSSGEYRCGFNKPDCDSKRRQFIYYGCSVSEVKYLPTSGYWFYWWC